MAQRDRNADWEENRQGIDRRYSYRRDYGGGGSDYAWRDFEDTGTFGAGYYRDSDYDYGQSGLDYVEEWSLPGPMTGRGPRNYRRSDDRIRDDVSDRLTQHGRIDASEIDVTVENGEVTLIGTVDSRSQKRMAEDVAESVSGVGDVHNWLRIRQPGVQEQGREQTGAETGRAP